VLATVGRLLLEHTRATDIPARIAGDEFAILLPDTNKAGAATMVERLTRGLAEAATNDGGATVRISTSFGISGYPWAADTVDGLVRQASDAALAQKPGDKRNRRNGSPKAEDSPPELEPASRDREAPQ
jgi:diguanylate cyclase (GGDEF)-like protein